MEVENPQKPKPIYLKEDKGRIKDLSTKIYGEDSERYKQIKAINSKKNITTVEDKKYVEEIQDNILEV